MINLNTRYTIVDDKIIMIKTIKEIDPSTTEKEKLVVDLLELYINEYAKANNIPINVEDTKNILAKIGK